MPALLSRGWIARQPSVSRDRRVLWAFQNQRDQNYTVLKTKANTMTVEGLKPGTTYVFRVRARTDGGYGSYSGEIELETSQEGNLPASLFFLLAFSLFAAAAMPLTGKSSDPLASSNGSRSIF